MRLKGKCLVLDDCLTYVPVPFELTTVNNTNKWKSWGIACEFYMPSTFWTTTLFPFICIIFEYKYFIEHEVRTYQQLPLQCVITTKYDYLLPQRYSNIPIIIIKGIGYCRTSCSHTQHTQHEIFCIDYSVNNLHIYFGFFFLRSSFSLIFYFLHACARRKHSSLSFIFLWICDIFMVIAINSYILSRNNI